MSNTATREKSGKLRRIDLGGGEGLDLERHFCICCGEAFYGSAALSNPRNLELCGGDMCITKRNQRIVYDEELLYIRAMIAAAAAPIGNRRGRHKSLAE